MIRFPNETLSQRSNRLSPYFVIVKPDVAVFGSGPYPTTIMLHGCGDENGPQREYAGAAAANGVASIIVNSYAPRKINKAEASALVCAGLRLWGRERAGDIFAALDWARQQDWVDTSHLSLAGWSHGGWTVMDALALGPEIGKHAGILDISDDALANIRSAFLVYPWCGAGAQTPSRGWLKPVRTFMLLAEKDSIAGVRFPLKALAAVEKSGASIASDIYRGMTHSFDEKITINPTFKYDDSAAQRAMAFYGKWISDSV